MGFKPKKAPRQESRQVSPNESVTLPSQKPRPLAKSRAVASPAIEISDVEVSKLVIDTFCHSRTVQRWARGEAVNPSTKLRLERACVKLGIERRLKEERGTKVRTRRIVETAA
jgi:hypothetical protein